MKKIIFLFILFFTLLFLGKSIFAFDLIKSQNNPLQITYIFDYNEPFQAYIYKENSSYKGILSVKKVNENFHSIALFESTDGINWQMVKEIFNNGKDLTNPRLFTDKNGDVKLLFAQLEGPSFYKIYSLDCDSQMNCSNEKLFFLDPDPTNYKENHGFFAPFIFLDNNNYFLFYGAWGDEGFKVRLASSDNLIDWQLCPENLIQGGDGPFVYKDNNKLYLFYHMFDSSGIKVSETNLPLTCSSIFTNSQYVLSRNAFYDQNHLIYPSVLDDNGKLSVYYSGLGIDNIWRLNLAQENGSYPTIIPTNAPTPTLIPTLTPTQVPTPSSTVPVVIIPGFMASWNSDALLHNEKVDYTEWQVAPFVKEYNGILSTFENLGYKQGKNIFVFSYDWRQNIDKTAAEFEEFLNKNVWSDSTNTKINIVGHSLGGLIARIWEQKYQKSTNVNHLITVGSPHQGVSQVYRPVEAGEIPQDNTWLWLAEKTLLTLNKSQIETDKVTLNKVFPILKDIFPNYDFIKKNNVVVPLDKMSIKNIFLSNFNINLNSLSPLLTIASDFRPTTAGYNVVKPNSLEQLLGFYPDGKPVSEFNESGDQLVLYKSSSVNTGKILALDHRELIYKKEAEKEILNNLNIDYSDNQIVEGQGTIFSPSVILFVKSPVKMKVRLNNQIFEETDGIIFIENAQTGIYDLNVQGKDRGKYKIIIGEIAKNGDSWNIIDGEIKDSIPQNQIDSYSISFNQNSSKPFFINQSNKTKLLKEVIQQLPLKIFHSFQCFKTLKCDKKTLFYIDDYLVKNNKYDLLEKLENVFNLFFSRDRYDKNNLSKKLRFVTGDFSRRQKELLKLKNKGKNIQNKLHLIELTDKKIKLAQESLNNQDFAYSEIFIESTTNLLEKL